MPNSVCETQDKFNNAFQGAVTYVEKKERPSRFLQLVSLIIMITVIIWALLLADKMNVGNDKIIHVVLALVFSPFYIISYYISN